MLVGVVVAILIFALVWFVVGLQSQDEQTVRHAQEIDPVLESANVGTLRASFEEDYIDETGGEYGFDARTAYAEILADVVPHYSNYASVDVDFVFFNADGDNFSVTNAQNRNDITEVQFRISVYDANGEVISTTTERRELHQQIGTDD